ncbi:putative rho GTPase-activating protein 30, partial [Triplophysa rosa]
RRGRRKGANRDKVFGCDLQEHLISTAQDIPSVLRNCSEFIEEYGIVDGIYRLSGVSSNTQKLRNEFDTEGTPELYKDVYLQDIHCVSSLCKAYFRELPNPLLTYELYDRFADAVAVQLEDERLVKIKEVLKDLPVPHYRTLEFLMHHLVKMSTFASQTNMHSRNLAIVWAPNLLRSKDIESTGFNGTAAFMEVRVQSIVVEFILTHVPEVFAAPGSAMERRKSLPSSSLLANQDEQFFKSLPLHCSGNLSPGDGPPPMRPYHAIIDSTDKRKGSLKGRKWKSIFNLGGRLQDPRKKNKYCPKDKEKTSLRPAKSMDSLSSGPYALEDSKHPPALVLSPANPEGMASIGGGVSSGYAVTYRRTGGAQVSMVSGGTPGTYNRLDSMGGAEGSSQGTSRSPGMSSKADRRAGIHISGPFSVTVPLHITSGLALGVLQGGWNEKEQTVQGDAADEEQAETEDEGEEVKGSEPELEQTYTVESTTDDDAKESKGDADAQLDLRKMTTQIIEEEDEETVKSDMTQHQETIERSVEDLLPQNEEEEYMDMRGHLHQAQVISADGREMDEFSEQDVQDAFGFLDMMDSCASNQLEFSVEAPEEIVEEDEDESTNNKAPVSPVQNVSDECETPAVNMSTHRALAGKSHSLPYKSRPFMPALSLSSDDDYSADDDEDDSDKDSEYEDMFCQSLPSALDFHRLSWSAAKTSARCADDALSDSQSKCVDDVILPPDNGEEPQSLSQSEDTILTPATDDGETPAGTSVQIYNEEHVRADSKMEDLHVDDEKNEVKSDDVTNDTNTMTVEGDPENSDGDEDKYFGPDPIPCSLEPNRTETASISVHEPIQEQCSRVDAPPYTEIYTAIEIIITDVTESTDAQDEVNINPSPDEENTTVHERAISDGEEMTTQPVEVEKSEESLEDEPKVFEMETPEREKILSGNEEDPEEDVEMEECVKDVNKTTEDEEEREEVKEHEPCEPAENKEQERVEMENSFDIDKEYNERNVEGTEKDTDGVDERLAEGNMSSEENSCEDDSCAQTEEPVKEKSSVASDEQPPQTPEDRPVPEEERETSAPKHAKAVPAVPPKPQRSKLTALTLRKQFEHKDVERPQRHLQFMDTDGPHDDETEDDTCQRDEEKPAENCREPTSETNGGGMAEIKAPRDGLASGDAGIDFRKDLQRDGEREAKRNSGVSMCFDEAVARATEKRSRETSERLSGAQWERECRREGFKHREKDDENKTD